jgi:two-component system, NtrC family, response regulator AtoC
MAFCPDSWDESTLSAEAVERFPDSWDEYYLVVVESDSSAMVRLPAAGEVVIGRGNEVQVRVRDSSVSRRHAVITVGHGEARIADLRSHNGTRVNGELISGTRPLVSGDVVQVCTVTLVFHASVRSHGRTILELEQLRQRAEGEIERSLRYQRPLTLLALSLAQAADRPRVNAALTGCMRAMDVAGWAAPDCALVLLPETDLDAAPRTAARLLDAMAPIAPLARVGFAACPSDGADVDTLLAAARAAAHAAAAGQVTPAARAFQTLALGGKQVIVADAAMARLYGLIERLAASELPVLVEGETGTGKELAASALHHFSARRDGPLVAVNCAAIAENLVESELFGHEKGAFTGAVATKPGLLEAAAGGTVFLDEIGELPLNVQAKLLRVLETRTVTRIGDHRERPIDIRIVAATNRNLTEEVKANRFRQDLFFRLSGATIWLPPLRNRRRELPILAQTFLAEAAARAGRAPMTISNEAMQRMLSYAWPGNVRELRNVMDYVAAACPDPVLAPAHLASRIDLADVPVEADDRTATIAPPARDAAGKLRFRPIDEEIRELERNRMALALTVTGGNQTRAAELIAMPLRTFQAKVRQYQLRSGRGR